MKKVVFAVQIFGLMVAIPLYFISELNHVSKPLIIDREIANGTKSLESRISKVLTDTTVDFDSRYLVFKSN
ncbi:MAG: hypothetical protein ABJA37_07800 [Ferruginibacter sp.]